ncbi:hypothetical protein ALC62_01123 [Cyphomyrmex costatus]|uniref:Uncharacterized protein n=1 Tax=Cyphomyrmex costatus TaxID=456900 RepID=A0A195D516_9HYME|nr:hypothetical protein ALC62_01123 [Cyphomyrmex costatus]
MVSKGGYILEIQTFHFKSNSLQASIAARTTEPFDIPRAEYNYAPYKSAKVKLFRLAIHYSRLTCRNYFGHGELPLKRQLESHKYAMRIYRTAGLAFPSKTVLRSMPNIMIYDQIHRFSMELRRVAKSVVVLQPPSSSTRASLEKDDFTSSYCGNAAEGTNKFHFRAGTLSISSAVAIDNPKLIPRYSQRRTVLKIGGVRLPEEGRDKNQWRFWSDATTSRSHVRHGHITANVLSANRALVGVELKLVTDTNKNDVSGEYYLASMSRSDTNERLYMVALLDAPAIRSGVCDGHARHSGNSHDFLVALSRIDPNHPPVCSHITTACLLPIVIYGLRGRPACFPNPSLRCTTIFSIKCYSKNKKLNSLCIYIKITYKFNRERTSYFVQPLSSSGSKGQPAREKLWLVQHK